MSRYDSQSGKARAAATWPSLAVAERIGICPKRTHPTRESALEALGPIARLLRHIARPLTSSPLAARSCEAGQRARRPISTRSASGTRASGPTYNELLVSAPQVAPSELASELRALQANGSERDNQLWLGRLRDCGIADARQAGTVAIKARERLEP